VPNELLDNFKKYEYVMNTDKKELIDELFKAGENKDEKVPLETIREKVQHYDQAHYEIMTLAEDEVNFKIFRVVTKKLKQELGDQANKIKEKILEATYNYCRESVAEVQKTYNTMIHNILHEPQNERELIQTKECHAQAPSEVERLTNVLKEVQKHLEMLEEFSYPYQDQDIEQFWMQRINPLRVQAALTDGKQTVGEKDQIFQATLIKDQEKFVKDIELYKEQSAKIKLLNSLPQAVEMFTAASQLNENLESAFVKKKEFNDREEIFGLDITPYQDLEQLHNEFKPFNDLIVMAYNIKMEITEWTQGHLHKQDPDNIATQVIQW